MISLDASVAISRETRYREIDGEAVILDLSTGQYFGLNRLGTRIWNLIDRQEGLAAVVETLEREYDVARDVLERDTLAIVSDLVDEGLLKLSGRDGSPVP